MVDTIFQTTVSGLETGLQVLHIAVLGDELRTCDADDERDSTSLFADTYFEDFDQVPVRKGDFIIGVVTPECKGTVKQGGYHPLDESMLISAQEPLTQFVPLMAGAPSYRLVLHKGRIRGIVTRSDLLKLPVRLFAFMLVTHLELLMANIIHVKYPTSKYQDEPQWFHHLNKTRQGKVKEEQQKLKQKNYELPLLECTDFCDKREIVKKIYPLHSRSKFKKDMEDIEKYLRNKVAHAGNYAPNDQEMERFIHLVGLTQEWIGKLEPYQEEHGTMLPE